MKPSLYFKEYVNNIINGLISVNTKDIDAVFEQIVNAIFEGKNIFVCGNGGSAAIADHFCCDHSKCVNTDTDMLPQFQPLTGNISTLTAIANDMGYEKVFSYQLKLKAKEGDVLIAISCSGNSPNVVEALKLAKANKVKTIAFVGFDGGQAKELADYCLHVNVNNYGVVEDCHQALMHLLSQSIRLEYLNKDTYKL